MLAEVEQKEMSPSGSFLYSAPELINTPPHSEGKLLQANFDFINNLPFSYFGYPIIWIWGFGDASKFDSNRKAVVSPFAHGYRVSSHTSVLGDTAARSCRLGEGVRSLTQRDNGMEEQRDYSVLQKYSLLNPRVSRVKPELKATFILFRWTGRKPPPWNLTGWMWDVREREKNQ